MIKSNLKIEHLSYFGGDRYAAERDLYAIKDISARARAAVKVLEEQGYEVGLRRGGNWPPKKKRKPFLRVVDSSKPEDD